jgi:thymidine kinase
MFAGKTTETLKRVLWAKNGLNRSVRVLKPKFDDRYAEAEIVSHDGLRTPAESIAALPQEIGQTDLVVLDEIQFFPTHVQGDLYGWVQDQLGRGVEVIAAGLDMDWQGKPFEGTALLMGMADEVIKLNAHCTVCGRPARKTFKLHQCGDSVELGASDKYESRCNTHW